MYDKSLAALRLSTNRLASFEAINAERTLHGVSFPAISGFVVAPSQTEQEEVRACVGDHVSTSAEGKYDALSRTVRATKDAFPPFDHLSL